MLGSLNYELLSLDTDTVDPNVYYVFINKLRDELKGSIDPKSKIPVLPAQVSIDSNNRFVLVELYNTERSATLAIDVVDSYIVGYKVGITSYYFQDVAADIYTKNPLGTTTKKTLPFGGGYPNIESKYKISREDVPLGITQLNAAVSTFNKYDDPNQGIKAEDVARSALVVIQMMAEVARFKYIEEVVEDNFFYLDPKRGDLISLENNWVALSTAIQRSAADGTFIDCNGKTYDITLQNKDYKFYNVSEVGEVKLKMGIMKYVQPCNGLSMFGGNNFNLIRKFMPNVF